ncbi:MAG TPA: hypothetical protein VGJ70_06075 [Solirubrobacteraceae bacterium]
MRRAARPASGTTSGSSRGWSSACRSAVNLVCSRAGGRGRGRRARFDHVAHLAHETLSAGYDNSDAVFIEEDEDRALDWLAAAPGPGGVLARPYLGSAPGRTGRPTFVGNQFWTPDFSNRVIATNDVFTGHSASVTQRMVRRSGARFVLADCRPPVPLRKRLGRLLVATGVFGCARVFERTHRSRGGA